MAKEVNIATDILDSGSNVVVKAGDYRLNIDSIQIMPGRKEIHVIVNRINMADYSNVPLVVVVDSDAYAALSSDDIESSPIPNNTPLGEVLKLIAWNYLEANNKRELVFGRPATWDGAASEPTPDWIDRP